MSVLNTRKTATAKVAKSASDIIVRRSKQTSKAAPMLTEDIVPAGKYHSVVIAVADAKSDTGKLLVDVTYRLTDTRGKSVDARIRYPAEGYHIERLFDALIDAGLPEESPMTDAVGIVEEIEVVYPFDGALGKIKARHPAPAKQPTPKSSQVKKARPHPLDDDEDKVDDENDVLANEEDEDFEDDFLDDDD